MMNALSFDWKNPNYQAVYTERMERLKRIRADKGNLPALIEYYKTHPAEFIDNWLLTYDPRLAEVGLPTTIPFILFPKQREFITWLYERWRNREDGIGEKSRDVGFSWLCVSFAIWMWRFHPGTVIGFGSRKESLVDAIGDPKTLFWKTREAINLLPVEFRPAGYDRTKHAPYMRILNPENGASIIGEAGDNIGRGARTSIYFLDEAAFIEHADNVDAALSQTSNCKIWVSTPNGNGNTFYRKRHSGRIPVFTFNWQDDPRKDEKWYEKQIATLDPIIVAQEIDIDYNASVADAFITGEAIVQAQKNGPGDIEPVGPWIIGVDAAHFGDDESIITKRRGRLVLEQIARRGIDGHALAALVSEECFKLERNNGRIHAIVIELDGPGVSCYDTLMQGRYASQVQGIHTGARLSDDKNYNLKARMYRALRDFIEEPPIVLPNDPELRVQLASIRYGYKSGLLLMQSKKDYKGKLGKSPDRADSLALTFAVDVPPEEEDRRYVLPRGKRGGGTSWMAS